MVQNNEKVYGVSKERLEALFDSGTFVELSAYTKRSASKEEPESVCCGYGAVSGKLVFAFAQDGERTKGAFSDRHARKIESLYSLAVKNGAPVVGMFDSKGVSIYDGAEGLAAYGRLMKAVSDASGVIPQIALIEGTCGGAAAVAAAMFDLTVTIKGVSDSFVKAPFVTGADKNTGRSAYEAESETEAFGFIKKLLAVLPANNADSIYSENGDSLNRQVAIDGADTETVLAQICDNGELLRLYENETDNMIMGLASFGGVLCGVVASNNKTSGELEPRGARAAAGFIGFCDSFAIPVLTLVDSAGTQASAEAEAEGFAQALAELAYAYTSSSNAKVTVVLGKAYGAAFTLLGSKSVGADMALALPTAEISVLSPEASVAFVWNNRVGEKSREELEDEWRESCASAENAADRGEIDDIVEPAELRQRICAALSMLAAKAEGTPERKHVNMPL